MVYARFLIVIGEKETKIGRRITRENDALRVMEICNLCTRARARTRTVSKCTGSGNQHPDSWMPIPDRSSSFCSSLCCSHLGSRSRGPSQRWPPSPKHPRSSSRRLLQVTVNKNEISLVVELRGNVSLNFNGNFVAPALWIIRRKEMKRIVWRKNNFFQNVIFAIVSKERLWSLMKISFSQRKLSRSLCKSHLERERVIFSRELLSQIVPRVFRN